MANRTLDHLRLLLDHLDGTERDQQLAFFNLIREIGPGAVEELDSRLPGSRAPRDLRLLAMEASFYFPWPEWLPILQRLLRYESELDIFNTGVRALARMDFPEALAVLRELHAMRQGGEFKEFLAEVITQSDPQEAFDYYLGRLLQGSANAGVANEAAQRLLQMVDGSSIEALKTVAMHPDLLVFRHALSLLAHIFTAEAAEALLQLFMDSHWDVLADRKLKEALASFRSLTPASAGEAAVQALASLEAAPGSSGEALRTFYRAILAAAIEGGPSPLGTVIAQTTETMHLRARRLGFAVDVTAEGLAAMAGQGLIDSQSVLTALVESYYEQTGREGVARAIARLAPAQAQEIHQILLEGPDGAQRAAAVEVLGGREEAALEPALLLACRDPITDIADRARFFLGRLPGAEALAGGLLQSAIPSDFQLGLQLVAEHRFQGQVPVLLSLLQAATREELIQQLIDALGALGGPLVVEPLLEMLHSGHSLRVQTALAQALGGLAAPEVVTALCAKVNEIKIPSLHGIAVEALGAAIGATGNPPPEVAGPLLLDQVRRAWNGRDPWPLRLRLVQILQPLALAAPGMWIELAGLVNAAIQEKRPPNAWDSEDLRLVQGAVREFVRRGA